MTFLNDDELSRLRSEFSVLLPETVTIQRPVNTVNVYGDTVTVWVTRATTTGRLDPEGTRQTDFVVAVREEQRDYFTLTLAYDADIEAGDRVVISSIQYEVLTLHETHTKKAVIRCRVVEFTSDVESDAVLAATFTASYASAGTATPVATAGTNVLWYWGDGETSTGTTPSHEYTTAGTKTILMYDADNVNALDMSSENLTAAEVDWSKITGARSVDFSGNSMAAAALDNVLADIYTYRSSFTFPNPTLDLTGDNNERPNGNDTAPPAAGNSDSDWTWDAGTSTHIPQTGLAYKYALENDPNGEGFSTWTVTVNAPTAYDVIIQAQTGYVEGWMLSGDTLPTVAALTNANLNGTYVNSPDVDGGTAPNGDSCALFNDANNDYADFDTASFDSAWDWSNFYLSFWCRPTVFGSGQTKYAFVIRQTSPTEHHFYAYHSNGNWRFDFFIAGARVFTETVFPSVNDGQNHIGITFRDNGGGSGAYRIDVNGSTIYDASHAIVATASGVSLAAFGRDPFGGRFDGAGFGVTFGNQYNTTALVNLWNDGFA